MSKKNHKKTNKQVGTEKEVREFIKMMAKAWAALKAIAKNKGFDAEELFERVVPSFAEEMESIVNEAAGQK